jgi:hypothetical protein
MFRLRLFKHKKIFASILLASLLGAFFAKSFHVEAKKFDFQIISKMCSVSSDLDGPAKQQLIEISGPVKLMLINSHCDLCLSQVSPDNVVRLDLSFPSPFSFSFAQIEDAPRSLRALRTLPPSIAPPVII